MFVNKQIANLILYVNKFKIPKESAIFRKYLYLKAKDFQHKNSVFVTRSNLPAKRCSFFGQMLEVQS